MEELKKQGMESLFCAYEQALALKELGFDEPCLMAYIGKGNQLYSKCDDVLHLNAIDVLNPLKAPTFSQAFRWFREKHKIGTWIHHYFNMDKGNFEYSFVITLPYKDDDGYVYEKHEEAELACLRKLIEIVKNK